MATIPDRAKKVRYLLRRDGPICHYCGTRLTTEPVSYGEQLDNQVTLDHIIPRSRGGGDHLENFALSCWACNQRKGRDLYENHCKRCRKWFAAVAEMAAERVASLAPRRAAQEGRRLPTFARW